MGSNGSVMPFFLKKRESGVLPITHTEMTRFNISLAEGVEMVLHALETAWGGELFVPKLPSYRIMDVAKAIGPECEYKVVGVRPGEKIHEEMITSADSFTTYDLGRMYTILPQLPIWNLNEYLVEKGAEKVPEGFRYSSDQNSEWLDVEALRSLISDNIAPLG
jgi:FlaA1/EpsC-like NDP-sugar epimerase